MLRDCLELPPVPGPLKGNAEACDGPDLLQLHFFFVSLHFLLYYTPTPRLYSPFSCACSPRPLFLLLLLPYADIVRRDILITL